MTTKRTPKGRKTKPRLSAEALAVFQRMQALSLQCSCPEVDRSQAREFCPACVEYDDLDWRLHDLLGLRVWERTVEDPEAEAPFPPGHAGNPRPDHEAQARWRMLASAMRATARI